ncbi:phospholipase DDHD2 [Galendromus occidentalis]|uniref:Phospholipase DDHD2 n=1 Tax=Galendromus occidentalis TaxID=34638 RepID=A0AAJ7SER3_9ACAR|nr:phospholipase DDHD2 [Galendromus occidentalis]
MEGSSQKEVRQILSHEGAAGGGAAAAAAARPTTLAFEAPNRGPSPLPLPLKPHWFYMKQNEKQWIPFSLLDSNELENAHVKGDGIVTVCGGRFEVDLSSKKMYPVYWQEPVVIHVRRCSWFFKNEGDTKYTPYDEDIAHILEETYQKCHNLNKWNRQIDIGGNQYVKMFNPNLMTHQVASGFADEWGNISDSAPRPRMVKRGAENIAEGVFEAGESETIDHLIFVVHGIGAVCDFKMRTVEQCLDEFRSMSNQLIQNHFAEQFQTGKVGRVEFLPVSWHSKLHGETTGLDEKLQKITINTISRVREFLNDTILDALLYTSPVYCQTIVDQVGSELNRLYHLFKKRNPKFNGTIGLAGHSLGSLILYDILIHQRPASATPVVTPQTSITPATLEELFDQLAIERNHIDILKKHEVDVKALEFMNEADLLGLGIPVGPVKKIINVLNRYPKKVLRRKQSYTRAEFLVQGNEGTGQLTVNYPQLEFQPDCFFAMGSPIAMFIVVRGNETLGKDYRLPTCPRFFNIYHPYDPIAYRMEPLIDPSPNLEPAQIPHHKGRKRIHLEVKESLKKVSTEVRQKIVGAVSVLSSSLQRRDSDVKETPGQDPTLAEGKLSAVSEWALNSGRRVDYVLQEGPFESFNEYLSVLFSHACYWESEDTLLLMVKEHYALRNIHPNTATKYAPLIPFYPLSPTSPTEPGGERDKEAEVGPFWSSVATITNYFSSSRPEPPQKPLSTDS